MALERQCTILIPNESSAADKDDSGDFLKDMEQNDAAVKKSAVKRLIRNRFSVLSVRAGFCPRSCSPFLCSINGDNSSGALMQVIRYCVPFDDHELKKLVYAHCFLLLPPATSSSHVWLQLRVFRNCRQDRCDDGQTARGNDPCLQLLAQGPHARERVRARLRAALCRQVEGVRAAGAPSEAH
jgi:hypothetical protein